ncbi:MAG: ATP-binding protein [Desulfobacterales bacterium]|nr:ATP-binding protein [Desulfobacterales bacterium]
MKIGHKLILGFLVVTIMAGIVGYIGATNINNIGKIFALSAIIDMPELIASMEMESASRQASIKAIEYSLRGKQSDKTKTFEALDKLDKNIDHLNKLSETEISIYDVTPEDREIILGISSKTGEFKSIIKEYIALKDKELPLEKLFFKEEEIHQARKQLVYLLYEKKEHELNELSESVALTNIQITKGINIITILSLTSVFLALLIGLFITRSITKPIKKLNSAADEIGKGNLEAKVAISSKDEIGHLAESFNKMAEDLKINKENLEAIVDERTAELKTVNQQLQKEVNKHKQAKESLLESANQTRIAYDQSIIYAKQLKEEIAKRKRFAEDLQESEKQYRETINSMVDWILVVDSDLKIRLLNSAFMKINKELGLETDVIGKTPMEIYPFIADTLLDEYSQVFENKKMLVTEETTIVNDKEFITESRKIPLFEGDKITRIVSVIHDMTEHKRLESQLMQAQKMEAIGRLSGGIAHDFNNLLTTIIGYCEIILITIPKDDPIKEKIEFIHAAGEKAATLTHQLLAFSRKQVLKLKPVNLNKIVENMGKMTARIIGEDVKLQFKTNLPIGNIIADSGQIEQILMNLAVNARDAMPNGGSLIIETAEVFLDNEFAIRHEGLKPGSYIMLAVTDTGEGMTQEVQKKIFEPFFTTKELGKGTGLGLATIFGIVKQHNGYINVYSESGSGTTFKIYLPLAGEAKEEKKDKKQMSMPQGREIILVVDDAPSICGLVTDTLQPLGYKVLEAYSAKDAIEISKSKKEKIDLLLTDVIMPEMNGKELADALKQMQSDIKVIFMSGYTDNVIIQEGIMESGLILINKPLIPSVLARKLREVLDK